MLQAPLTLIFVFPLTSSNELWRDPKILYHVVPTIACLSVGPPKQRVALRMSRGSHRGMRPLQFIWTFFFSVFFSLSAPPLLPLSPVLSLRFGIHPNAPSTRLWRRWLGEVNPSLTGGMFATIHIYSHTNAKRKNSERRSNSSRIRVPPPRAASPPFSRLL